MSGKTIGWVFDHSPFTGATFAVHLAIGDSANDQNDYEIWWRLTGLAAKARVSDGACRKAVAELVDAGLLEELDNARTSATDPRPRRFRMMMPTRADDASSPAARAHDASTRAHDASSSRPRREPYRTQVGTQLDPNALTDAPTALFDAPRTSDSPPPSSNGHDLAFEAFWSAYPRRAGKPKARAAWQSALRRGASSTDVVAGARSYAADPNRTDEYTAHPTTWLNRDGWNDPPLPARNGNRRSRIAGFANLAQEAIAEGPPVRELGRG